MEPTRFDMLANEGSEVESAYNVQPGSNFEPVGQQLFQKYIDNAQRTKAYDVHSNQNVNNKGPKNTRDTFLLKTKRSA